MDTSVYRRPEKVLVYLYRRTSGSGVEYLLLQRSQSQVGHIWQAVVGTARWGEELVEAARREVFEETGLTRLSGITAIGYAFSFVFCLSPEEKSRYAPGVTVIRNVVFAAEVLSPQSVSLSDEHIAYQWFPYAEAVSKIHWSEDREALVRLHPMVSAI